MLSYDLDSYDGPLYEKIYKSIKDDVYAGRIHPGEKLPSKRKLATTLGVSVITVENAYGQLQAEGYVHSYQKRGYFIAELPGIATGYRRIKSEATREEYNQKRATDKPVDLSNTQANPKLFPFALWARLMREVISEREDEIMDKSPCNGVYPLRNAITGLLATYRQMQVEPERIVVGSGSESIYGILVQLLGRDKVYGVENPGYRKLSEIYRFHGVATRFIGLDESGLSLSELMASNAQIAHISPTHHFPTGATTPIARRYELLGWSAARSDRHIIEDDYDSEFRFTGRPIPSMQSVDATGKVIYLNTFSQTISPTIRVGYVVLPSELHERYTRDLSFYSNPVSNFIQLTLAEFIARGHFDRLINRSRLYYERARRRALDAIQSSSLASRCEIFENDSGLHFLLRLKTRRSEESLAQRFEDSNVRLDSLSKYYHDDRSSNAKLYLFSYSNLEGVQLDRALETIAKAL